MTPSPILRREIIGKLATRPDFIPLRHESAHFLDTREINAAARRRRAQLAARSAGIGAALGLLILVIITVVFLRH
jgi:hypothetical protein